MCGSWLTVVILSAHQETSHASSKQLHWLTGSKGIVVVCLQDKCNIKISFAWQIHNIAYNSSNTRFVQDFWPDSEESSMWGWSQNQKAIQHYQQQCQTHSFFSDGGLFGNESKFQLHWTDGRARVSTTEMTSYSHTFFISQHRSPSDHLI